MMPPGTKSASVARSLLIADFVASDRPVPVSFCPAWRVSSRSFATLMSARLPGVRVKATGRPRSSASACILLVRPPRERPTAWIASPFFGPSGRAVDLDVSGVDGELLRDAAAGGELLEEPSPDTLDAPAVDAIEDGRPGAVDGRAVAPSATRSQHIEDAADHPSIIGPSRPRTVLRQMGVQSPPRPHR